MTYQDKLTALKSKTSTLTDAVNKLPTNDTQKPVNVGAVNSAIEAVESAVSTLND